MIRNLIFFVLVLIIAACGATNSLFKPIESDASKMSTNEKSVTLVDLQSGFKLYSTNCAGCHFLYAPASKNKSEWEVLLLEMFSRTQLTIQQRELVRQYIYSKL